MNLHPILAFGGPQDMLIIFFVVLLLFGSKKLPELARGMGSAVREFNKAKDELERELTKPAPTEVVVQPAQGRLEHQPVAAAAIPPAAAPVAPGTEAPAPAAHAQS